MNMNEIEQALRPGLVSVSTVAQILGTSRAGAYVLVKRGDVDAVRIGARTLVFSAPLRERLRLPPISPAVTA